MGSAFERLITEATLADLAGDRSYERGARYFEDGAVVDLVEVRDAIKARVLGSTEYRVVLRSERGQLGWSCTCPIGKDGDFCKHAVAAGLAWLERGGEAGGDDLAEVRTLLEGESREALVEIVLDQAAGDPELRARLQAATLRRSPPSDLRAMKIEVRKALAVRGFVDYHGMGTFIARAGGAVDLLSSLLESGRAAEAVELADYAMRCGIAAYQKIDDSDGGFGEVLHAIAACHVEACRKAGPDPDSLGRSVFELQMLDEWGFLELGHYAPLLGEKGLAGYRALAQAQWNKVPARGPGEKNESGTGHYLITAIMESLAQHDGDVDALVAVQSRDLSYPYRFVNIAEILAKAGRHGEALAWAERGRQGFPNDLDPRLAEFLVTAYHRAGRHEDAVRIAWEGFAGQHDLAGYVRLEKSATRAKAWPAWRDKALARLRGGPKRTGRDHTLLVEIFLREGDSDTALIEARAGGCAREGWMRLARAREKDHPQDAAAIYRESVDIVVSRMHNEAYDEAAVLLGRIKVLMARAEQSNEFVAWLAALRIKHKAKRNLMKRIEGI